MGTSKNIWQLGNLHTMDSKVMGLPENVIFANGRWQGFLMDPEKTNEILELINTRAEWRPRQEAEVDPSWKQIYPYALFKYQNYYSEFKRGTTASDTRMNLKYTMAVGGHVFQKDYQQSGNSFNTFIQQIFHQDIDYKGNLTTQCLGVINDQSDNLGRYHVGIVYVLEGDNGNLKSKIHTESRLVKLADMTGEDVEFLERWSQMIYRQLRDKEIAGSTNTPQHFHVSHLLSGQ